MTLTIPAHDRDGVRVFTAKLTPDDLDRDKARLATELLGDPDLDPAFIEIFDLADLTAVGLSTYLVEGLGVPSAAIPDPDHLDALQGPVLILLSKALHGRAARLTPDPRLTLIGTYAEDRQPVHFEPLQTPAAQGQLTPDPTPDPTPQQPMAAFLLLALALILTAAMALWLALW